MTILINKFWMSLRRFIIRIENHGIVDWHIKRGDWVKTSSWRHYSLEVIDVNWALRAIAVRLRNSEGKDGAIVVWPIHGMKRCSKPQE